MANLICDTNVFYNLGLGKMKPADFPGRGDKLLLLARLHLGDIG